MPGWVLRSEEDAEVILRVPHKSVRTLGRTARADFIVNRPLVSRLHCRLTADGLNQLVVEDLGSRNGTRVNGRKINRATLRVGDRLTVGRLSFSVAER